MIHGGSQDTGSEVQTAPGSIVWEQDNGGDGFTVQYDGTLFLRDQQQLLARGRSLGGTTNNLLLASPATPLVQNSGLNATDQNQTGFISIPRGQRSERRVAASGDPWPATGCTRGRSSRPRRWAWWRAGDVINDITPAAATGNFRGYWPTAAANGMADAGIIYASTSTGDFWVREHLLALAAARSWWSDRE